jgi:predicted RNA-binding Zn ribbon-like protein
MPPAPGDLATLEAFVNSNDDLDAPEAAFREALRALLADKRDREAIAALDRAARDAHLAVRFAPDGSVRLQAVDAGRIGSLLAIVARAQADGTWSRMKACRADDCRWAFYDRSRNRSRAWCSMSECGNRAKARSYRARQR